jgi:YD repeat-containing protein
MIHSAMTYLIVDNAGSRGESAIDSRVVTSNYTPDKLNRSSMNDSGTVTNYSPNALNQYTSVGGTSVSYDDNFNLAHTIGYNGIYDAANRLVSASNGGSGEAQQTVAAFVYDGLGRCVKRTLNGVATVVHFSVIGGGRVFARKLSP